ncbi:hypothetical protein U9M48_002025 [Paspalum notatum var. saurae]|uniref:Uncharacterized protein n=1 Tax=Paspalum notatum var. saurae TaxID=547442 RepID=A0AAQ3PN43_PASNO
MEGVLAAVRVLALPGPEDSPAGPDGGCRPLQRNGGAAKLKEKIDGRCLKMKSFVGPLVDVAQSIKDLDPETTMVMVVSKTFTTAETMLNARTLKAWIISSLTQLVKDFGIDPNNAFAFRDWVGGRYSGEISVGVLPLSLQHGFPIVQNNQQALEASHQKDDTNKRTYLNGGCCWWTW